MSFVLGVDPGVISGWALFSPEGHFLEAGQIRPSKKTSQGEAILTLLARLKSTTGSFRPITAGIEGQFLPGDAGAGQKSRHKAVSSLQTAISAGRWIGLCEANAVDIYQNGKSNTIPVNIWRRAIYGNNIMTKDQYKKYAITVATRLYQIHLKSNEHHMAEAIHIANYVSVMLRKGLRHV